jgi:anaerobic ribonucleoside-triphosphate reductase
MKSILDELMEIGYEEETAQELIAICTCDKFDTQKRRKRRKKNLFGKVIDGPIGKMPCEIWSRVSGYFRPISQWNPGKQEEFRSRKNVKIPNEL